MNEYRGDERIIFPFFFPRRRPFYYGRSFYRPSYYRPYSYYPYNYYGPYNYYY